MNVDSIGLVGAATSSTYVLSSVASTRLRKMTRVSGLPSENVISRLAIVESVRIGPAPELAPRKHFGKEIKGITLLGKPHNGAALLVLLVASQEVGPMTADRMRTCITSHWERGISILASRAKTSDVLTGVTSDLVARGVAALELRPDGYRHGGLGEGLRERVAAVVGRRHGRWPLEVRRLIAMAGRLSEDRALAVAAELEVFASNLGVGSGVSEGVALDFIQSKNLNRLGLNADDRRFLREVSDAGGRLPYEGLRDRDTASLEFLEAVGLIEAPDRFVGLSPLAERLGQEVWA